MTTLEAIALYLAARRGPDVDAIRRGRRARAIGGIAEARPITDPAVDVLLDELPRRTRHVFGHLEAAPTSRIEADAESETKAVVVAEPERPAAAQPSLSPRARQVAILAAAALVIAASLMTAGLLVRTMGRLESLELALRESSPTMAPPILLEPRPDRLRADSGAVETETPSRIPPAEEQEDVAEIPAAPAPPPNDDLLAAIDQMTLKIDALQSRIDAMALEAGELALKQSDEPAPVAPDKLDELLNLLRVLRRDLEVEALRERQERQVLLARIAQLIGWLDQQGILRDQLFRGPQGPLMPPQMMPNVQPPPGGGTGPVPPAIEPDPPARDSDNAAGGRRERRPRN